MFHEHGDDDVDEHELSHQHEDDEEDGSNDGIDAAVAHAVRRLVAVFTQRILPTRRTTTTQSYVADFVPGEQLTCRSLSSSKIGSESNLLVVFHRCLRGYA